MNLIYNYCLYLQFNYSNHTYNLKLELLTYGLPKYYYN